VTAPPVKLPENTKEPHKMNFEQWYETYECDGGELMLYNTIDLQAAYNAGLDRAIEIAKKLIIENGLKIKV